MRRSAAHDTDSQTGQSSRHQRKPRTKRQHMPQYPYSPTSRRQTAPVPDQHQQPSTRVSLQAPRQPGPLKKRTAVQTAPTIKPRQTLDPAAQPVRPAEHRSTSTQKTGLHPAASKQPELPQEGRPASLAAPPPETQLLLLPCTFNGRVAWLLVDGGAQQASCQQSLCTSTASRCSEDLPLPSYGRKFLFGLCISFVGLAPAARVLAALLAAAFATL